MEFPELYDLRNAGSGVVPDDEGVALFLGIKEGDVESGVLREEPDWPGTGGVEGGINGIVDMRFARFASVGLMVRAPNPVACGIVETRLFVPGVPNLEARSLGDLGDLGAVNEDERVWSGVSEGFK